MYQKFLFLCQKGKPKKKKLRDIRGDGTGGRKDNGKRGNGLRKCSRGKRGQGGDREEKQKE